MNNIHIIDYASMIKTVTSDNVTNFNFTNILRKYRHRNKRLYKIKKIFNE